MWFPYTRTTPESTRAATSAQDENEASRAGPGGPGTKAAQFRPTRHSGVGLTTRSRSWRSSSPGHSSSCPIEQTTTSQSICVSAPTSVMPANTAAPASPARGGVSPSQRSTHSRFVQRGSGGKRLLVTGRWPLVVRTTQMRGADVEETIPIQKGLPHLQDADWPRPSHGVSERPRRRQSRLIAIRGFGIIRSVTVRVATGWVQFVATTRSREDLATRALEPKAGNPRAMSQVRRLNHVVDRPCTTSTRSPSGSERAAARCRSRCRGRRPGRRSAHPGLDAPGPRTISACLGEDRNRAATPTAMSMRGRAAATWTVLPDWVPAPGVGGWSWSDRAGECWWWARSVSSAGARGGGFAAVCVR